MAYALEFFFDDEADAAVRELWQRLEFAGVPSLATRTHRRHRPHVSFAVAGSVPRRARAELAGELGLLSLPALWLYTLGVFPTGARAIFLGAVVDTELLAVHSAVHDVLAGKVTAPSAYYLPGAWVPHCTLAHEVSLPELAKAFAALHPVRPVRATVSEVGITDTRTGDVDVLLTR
jgi:2'-5' RNA ligase